MDPNEPVPAPAIGELSAEAMERRNAERRTARRAPILDTTTLAELVSGAFTSHERGEVNATDLAATLRFAARQVERGAGIASGRGEVERAMEHDRVMEHRARRAAERTSGHDEHDRLPCGCTIAPDGWRTRAMSCNAHGSDGWSAYVGRPVGNSGPR